jgi:hypothetical protein
MPQSQPTAEINRRVTVILKVKEGSRLNQTAASDKVSP